MPELLRRVTSPALPIETQSPAVGENTLAYHDRLWRTHKAERYIQYWPARLATRRMSRGGYLSSPDFPDGLIDIGITTLWNNRKLRGSTINEGRLLRETIAMSSAAYETSLLRHYMDHSCAEPIVNPKKSESWDLDEPCVHKLPLHDWQVRGYFKIHHTNADQPCNAFITQQKPRQTSLAKFSAIQSSIQ